jgi:hypothetical protein
VSRAVRDRVRIGDRGVVLAVQRRACHVAVEGGPLLILSRPGVPLAPNALTVDVGPIVTLEDGAFRVGQAIALGASAPFDRDVDWVVTFGMAATWEPRPSIHRVAPRELVDRLRPARATVVADGAGESLLPLLWASEFGLGGPGPGLVRTAGISARLLSAAAARRDEGSVVRAARGLAGVGPGLTPSGDDLLAGFAAAWILVGESLGHDGAAHQRVADAVLAGGESGASPLGRVWLRHACRGELLEPMTRFVAALLAAESRDLGPVVRDALAVGSSSGTDWMVGFHLGAVATLEAARRERPW